VPDRRLILVRHAEAGSATADRDRQLTPRGQRQAAAVGAWLVGAGITPDGVLVSPARRTLQTWDRLREALGPTTPERIADERLYANTVDAVLEAIREAAGDVTTLLVVGHNPSVGQLARLLDDDGSPAARERLSAGFPPAAVAVFDVPWPFGELDLGGATLVDAATPGG
jgi:phosphohistidine phosphatase